MKAMNFLEYNGHKFTGVILMDNGEFRVAGETISLLDCVTNVLKYVDSNLFNYVFGIYRYTEIGVLKSIQIDHLQQQMNT